MGDVARDPSGRRGARAVRTEYARLARRYDRRWSAYVAGTVRETVRRLPLRPGLRVLDAGCGTGALLEALRARAPDARLVGLDLVPEMLDVARARPLAAPLLAGDVHALPFAAGAFDLVVTTSSFHFWDRPADALAEVARVLRPDGRLVVTDWCHDDLLCRACDVLLRAARRRHRAALGVGACRERLEASGFREVDIERFRVGWLWGLMTAVARRPSLAAT